MPHSLRVKIKKLRYKGVITDKDCDRLINGLDNMDTLDKIKSEIRQQQWYLGVDNANQVIEIIDKHIKHRAESEEENEQM